MITTETVRHAYGADVLVIDHPDTGTPHLIPRRSPSPRPVPPNVGPRDHPTGDRPIPTSGPHPPKEQSVPVPPRSPVPPARPVRAARSPASPVRHAARRCGGGSACPSSTTASTAAATAPTATATAGYPVTVTNCGTSVTYTQAPTRAVSNDINTTEDMLALGLESHMVGEFGVSGTARPASRYPAQYPAGFQQVHEVSRDYFTLEKLVGLHPDFLFAGWNYGLQVGTNLTPHQPGQVRHQDPGPHRVLRPRRRRPSSRSRIDDTYQDLTNLGEIFDVASQGPAADRGR